MTNKPKKLQLSIIIVNYKVEEKVLSCIESIYSSDSRISKEIIVVDNSPTISLKKKIAAINKDIQYIPSKVNVGYGQGNNIGFSMSKGMYVLFLNPDTRIFSGALLSLVTFIEKKQRIGMVAPLLMNIKSFPYQLQGTKLLTPFRALFSISLLNKFFPNNPISKSYWNIGWNKTKVKEVDVVPGTAFMMRREVFEKAGTFDKNFFLFFEEFDLALRVKRMGYKNYILPDAKIFHEWGESTKQLTNVKKIFSESRKYYFTKNFGFVKGNLTNFLLSINRYQLMLIFIVFIGTFLRFFHLFENMVFIGDQGWFYLSAYKLLVEGEIPLVGIPSSVVWLSQGALATYFIATALFLGKLHPVAPAILFSIFDVVTLVLVYIIGSNYFNRKAALFASLIYATSPLIVLSSRMPYHTSMIPFFACVFFLVLLKAKNTAFDKFLLSVFLYGLLLQHELSNAVLAVPLILVFVKKKMALTKKRLALVFGSLLLGVLPFVIYDITHGFIQTAGFPLWILNRVRLFFGLTVSGNSTTGNIPFAFSTMSQQFITLTYPTSSLISLIVTISLLCFFLYKGVLKRDKKLAIIGMWLFIPLGAFLVHAAPGAAYFPLIFPAFCLLLGYALSCVSRKYLALLFLVGILSYLNIWFLLKNDYYISSAAQERVIPSTHYSYGISWKTIDMAAVAIIEDSRGKDFSITGKDFYAMYDSNLDNLKYLVLWRGGRLREESSLDYLVYPKNSEIKKMNNTIYKDNYYLIIRNEKK